MLCHIAHYGFVLTPDRKRCFTLCIFTQVFVDAAIQPLQEALDSRKVSSQLYSAS